MVAERLTDLLGGLRQATVAVSGGSTPRELFRLLAGAAGDSAPWGRVSIFQVDERCVPPDHSDSNWRMLAEELLSKRPEIRAFRMETERRDAPEAYEALLRQHVPLNEEGIPVLDVVLLGMGPDGHTASLFPETEALRVNDRLVVRNAVPQLNTERVTMTFPLLNAAKHRWFLVRGADKAQAFARVQRGELPAARIVEPEWFVDSGVVTPVAS